MPAKIVLTGGPGAGKTVVCAQLANQMPDLFVHVPEAASRIYAMLATRWDRLDLEARRDVQRRIYRLQLEQESTAARQHAGQSLLLDRGSVDGAAYWPDGSDDYWRELGTTRQTELDRYDAVIWLESCAAIGAYDGDASNPCRFEDATTAIETGAGLAEVWAGHPALWKVRAYAKIKDKVARVREVVLGLLNSRP